MAGEETTEHSVQKSAPAVMDATYLQLRLDTQKLHQDILNFLQGTTKIVTFDANSNTYKEEMAAQGSPLANSEGIQNILTFVVTIINPHTIQGNTTREELSKMLFNMEMALSERLTLNSKKWEIDESNRDHIVDTIMAGVQLILTRTIDNLERMSYSSGVIEKYAEYKTNPKGKFF